MARARCLGCATAPGLRDAVPKRPHVRAVGPPAAKRVRVRDVRRVECGRIRHCGNRVPPATARSVHTRFPLTLTWRSSSFGCVTCGVLSAATSGATEPRLAGDLARSTNTVPPALTCPHSTRGRVAGCPQVRARRSRVCTATHRRRRRARRRGSEAASRAGGRPGGGGGPSAFARAREARTPSIGMRTTVRTR